MSEPERFNNDPSASASSAGSEPWSGGNDAAPIRYDLAGNPISDSANPITSNTQPQPFVPPGTYQPGASSYQINPYQAHPQTSAAQKRSDKLFAGLALAVVFMAVVVGFLLKGRADVTAVTAPTEYKLYECPDKSFTCEGPVNWTQTGFGTPGTNLGGILFRQNDYRIEITSDFRGSLMGDIMRPVPPISDDAPAIPQPPAIEKLHSMYRSSIGSKFPAYSEGQAMVFTAPGLGDSRCSEFTADGGLMSGKLRGIRVTMLGTERAFTVVCVSPAGQWDSMKDSYWRVVNSIKATP